MKNYTKPTLEIANITTNEAIATGSPVYSVIGTTEENGTPVTIYEIQSFEGGSQAQTNQVG